MPYLVLFVHGLTGDLNTFGNFPDLINQDSLLNSYVKVDQWIYPTKSFSTPFIKNSPRIQDLADSLRTELYLRDETSIILICHSLGGLVARQMLIDDYKKGLSSKVKHVFLYATPNEGSNLANAGKFFSPFQPQISQMSPGSDYLDNLNNDWHVFKMDEQISITYVIGALDSVVSSKSARGFWGNHRIQLVVDGDHINVAKPRSLEDNRYRIFQKEMLQLIKNPFSHKLVNKYKSTLTCIIVDDEIMSRELMQIHCKQHAQLDLVGTFDSAENALAFLAKNSVDLIWLDVEMPSLTGFDLLDRLNSTPFVVMTTKKTQYAYEAFQHNVTDYLKKPVTRPKFVLAVEKVLLLNNK